MNRKCEECGDEKAGENGLCPWCQGVEDNWAGDA